MSNTVIEVENISKQYRLGMIGTGALSHDLNRWWHNLRGKEDPYLKIGETNDRTTAGTSEYVWSLRDINFKIEQGDAVGIIGRNGAGKSTLLKILSRVTTPTTGAVKIKGRVASLLEVGTGFHPDLSGRENIFLNGAILGMRKTEVKRKFDEIVHFAGVERYIDTPVKRYSSGMYVRLAFGVAAHLESEILIVDEVLAVGDAEFQKKCLGKMNDVSKGEGRTVLFVSHNMGSINQLCNKGVLLKYGNVQAIGDITDITNLYLANDGVLGARYKASNQKETKKAIIIDEAYTVNKDLTPLSDFGFYDSIRLFFKLNIDKYKPNVKVGVALNDKYQNRVFTVVKDVKDFYDNETELGCIVEFQAGLIAPNSYSFTIAVFTPNEEVFDIVENVCPIQVHDTGTSFAQFEGIDYGSIIMESSWIKTN